MLEIEYPALPLALFQHECYTGLWLNEEKTFLSVAHVDDFPGVVPAEIKTMLNRGIHAVESLPEPDLVYNQDGMPVFIYELENVIMQTANFEKGFVDAALLAANPKMYLYSENGSLLVEHDEGFYLIASLELRVIDR